jgi:hypothetical protein
MNKTDQYIDHHKKIFSLDKKKKIVSSKKKALIKLFQARRLIGWSLFRLLKHHIKSFILCFLYLPKTIYDGRDFFIKTLSAKGSLLKKRALVIGNGPSQGYLTKNELDNFVKSGGETFCINFWHQNKNLSSHIPTWIVFSDSNSFNRKISQTTSLIKYLKRNPLIKIVVSTSLIKLIKSLKIKNEIYCFVDLELSICKNIHPLLPRGYLSMTLYKALAFAIYLGYYSIGIIGMDNTYPRNIYNDKNNRIFNLETHAGTKDYLNDMSVFFYDVSAFIDEIVRLFYHLEYFPNKHIVNLDPYSLTDRFKKVTKGIFFRKVNVKK